MRRAISCLLVVVFILVAACSSETENYAPVVNAWTQPAEKQGGYKVQPGDTLYSIAWSYGLDYTTIVDINKLKKPYHVEVGETIYLVAQNDVNAKQTNNKHVKHAVKQQKTLSKINEKEKKTDWRWPTAGQVSQKFSLSAPINKGIDIAGVVGQPIVAASAGVVVYSGNGIPGYGNLIIIKHNSEYLSAYANNKKNLVSENQKVKSGQKIAIMGLGNTGQPALHFEIRFRGKPINPLIKLPKKL